MNQTPETSIDGDSQPEAAPTAKKRSVIGKFFKGPEDPAVALYGVYILHKSGDLSKTFGQDKGRQALTDVTIELEEGSEMSKRVTMTRVLATGIFALALKKSKGGEKWLLIAGPDFEWFEEVPRKKQADAIKFVQAVRKAQRAMAR